MTSIGGKAMSYPNKVDGHFLIDGTHMYDFIVSGAGNIILNERYLNRINVFPVPDGDTGTNLALTMRIIISKAERNIAIGKTMSSIAKAAIENAYGNSGMIFAQFLHGFSEAVKQKDRLTFQEFAESSAIAVQYAYKAVASPKEGTILTVMREWTEELKLHVVQDSLESLLSHSIEKAQQIVEQTKSMMKVFRDNNVVDSGAKGFLLFLEGILAQVKHGSNSASVLAMNVEEDEHIHITMEDEELSFRFCTQFVVQQDVNKMTLEQLKTLLQELGDSLVVTGGTPLFHIHVHTNEPEKVIAKLVKQVQVLSHKVDDMALQQSITHHKKHKIGIITDSIADVPAEYLYKEQVLVIPVNIIHDGTVYQDKVTMTPRGFFEDIDTLALHPTSSQPTIAVIERAFTYMLSQYDEVIGLFVSEKMSGLHHNASVMANNLSKDGKKIKIVNTKQNSAAEGLLVMEAIQLREQGLPLDRIVQEIEKLSERTHIYVSVETLKFMLKGGRVSKIQGFVLSKLNLKPVISIDTTGKGTIWAKTFSRRSAIHKILDKFQSDAEQFGIRSYSLVYSDTSSVLKTFREKIENIAKKPPEYIDQISAVVALNAGRNTFALAYIKENG